jgi:hypothetical protein
MEDDQVETVSFGDTADLYLERYVAFLDILGFTGLIDGLKEEPHRVLEIRGILQTVHCPPIGGLHQFSNSELASRSISDAVAMCSAPSAHGLAHMFEVVQTLAAILLEKGYFLRGAIVKGRLFYDKQQMFGEALVQAYRLEKTVALYPRVMLTRQVVDDVEAYEAVAGQSEMFKGQVRQSRDGPRHLDILQRTLRLLNRPEYASRLVAIKDLIERRFQDAMDNPRHFEKVQWFAGYWNAVLGEADASLRIYGPGLAGPYAYFAPAPRK